MSSVTEQMLIHVQEFNVRLDGTDQLIQEINRDILQRLIEIQDKLDLLEFRLNEFRLKDKGYE